MFRAKKQVLLRPVSDISGLKYFNSLVQERVIFVGQLYLRHEAELLTLPKMGPASINTINEYLNEQGFANVPKVATDIKVRKDFAVSASDAPNLRLAMLRQDMDVFVTSRDGQDLRRNFSDFITDHRAYFVNRVLG